jgi:thermolysin/neutral peptidase B
MRIAACVFASILIPSAFAFAQGRPVSLASGRADLASLRAVDQHLDQMLRTGELRVREVVRDTLLADRTHERLDQYVRGVRIVGGDVTRQTANDGTVSVFGTLHDSVDVSTTPALSIEAAQQAIAAAGGGSYRGPTPELVIVPLSDGYHLAYLGQASTDIDIVNVFVDASNGTVIKRWSEFINEVATGTGTFGDAKKLSVKSSAGGYIADDVLRPSEVTTYDMKGNFARTVSILNGLSTLATDVASNATTQWADSTVVDGHVYAGWYYDYLQKRFTRRGLDDHDLRIPVLTHPVPVSAIGTAPPSIVGQYYVNAFWCPTCMSDRKGAITMGEGAPNGSLLRGVDIKPFSAALDAIAHELTHGVTSYTARLNSFPFSDAPALNEAFSDMFGTATEFFYQPAGNGLLKADYLIGEDLALPFGSFVIRSLNNPASLGDADHYSQRNPAADGHQQSTIASHAFYLAIEGGTNRTSGRSVTGVGAANRDQIEKVFFRALTVLLPSNATYALTRSATIQAARDLYGAGGAAERAVTQAWDAVGVQDRIDPVATILPNPATSTPATCGGVAPSWVLGLTVSSGNSNLQIAQWTVDIFDSAGRTVEHDTLSASDYASFFTSCGPGNSRILAQTDSCATVCVELNGATSGSIQASFTATTSAGQSVTFGAVRTALTTAR